MFCHAAQSLGYRVAVLDPVEHGPAGNVADLHIQAAYDDSAALARLAASCQAVTTEFENVPAHSLQFLAAHCRVSPSAHAVAIAQDRNAEKTFIRAQNIAVAPHQAIYRQADLHTAPEALFPGLLKVARMGYDGKGQAPVANRQQALAAFAKFGAVACVLEALVALKNEVSILVARGFNGETAVFPLTYNVHRQGILAVSSAAPILPDTAQAVLQAQASKIALSIADALQYHGVLCVEFFVLQNDSLLVNEIAPRPHNSGHYSIDACMTSQFEQQARIMAGLPLGSTALLAPAIMLNILGDIWYPTPHTETRREPDWAAVLAIPTAKLHLYGKQEARRGRKMGHVTLVAPTLTQARADAARVARALKLDAPE
jgi:5-(carboxyamino)imidazole ribonucleotide synthase